MLLHGGERETESFRSFWLTLIFLNVGLLTGGIVFARQEGIAASFAVPIIAAFLLQASLFVVSGFPQVRAWIEQRFPPPRLAAVLFVSTLAPYLTYAIPCGVFSLTAFAFLAGLCAVIAFLFVLAPPKSDALTWQDVIVMAALAYPMVSGLGSPFKDIYLAPSAAVPPLDPLGKLSLVSLGTMAFLSLRRLPRTNYRFAISRDDLFTGALHFVLFLAPGALVAIATGFVQWGPEPITRWTFPAEIAGNLLGIYLAVALPEEMYFRGVMQNLLGARLGSPTLALIITSLLFGLSHLGRGFPNWPYVAVTIVLGFFCGRAYQRNHSVPAAAVTHALVVLARRFLFS